MIDKLIRLGVRGCLKPFGLVLHRLPSQKDLRRKQEIEAKKNLWLINIGIKTVIDVGANTGQFAKHIRQLLPEATIYSFEPLDDCYKELVANFKKDLKFRAFNLALGDQPGRKEMYRNEFSQSSSFLRMKRLHKECFPYTERETAEEVSMACLDDLSGKLKLEKPILIKLDVQGFEDKVISGGQRIISQAAVLIVELSLERLYEEQLLFDGMSRKLVELGFEYRGNYHQIHNPNDGRALQVDGIFVRNGT